MPYGWEPRALDYAPLRGIAHLQEWYDRLLKDLSTSVENNLPGRVTQFWNDHRALLSFSTIAFVMGYHYTTHPEELVKFTGVLLSGLVFGKIVSDVSIYQSNRAFVQALVDKNFALARRLLFYIDPNTYDTRRRWDTLMHATLRLTYQPRNDEQDMKRYKEIFLSLVGIGGDINKENMEFQSCMHFVLKARDAEFLLLLAQLGGNINVSLHGITPLISSGIREKLDDVKELLFYHAKPDVYFSCENFSLLIEEKDFTDVKHKINEILSKEDPSYVANEDQSIKFISLLFFAIVKNKVSLAKLLLEEGKLDPNSVFAFRRSYPNGDLKKHGSIIEMQEHMSPEMKELVQSHL